MASFHPTGLQDLLAKGPKKGLSYFSLHVYKIFSLFVCALLFYWMFSLRCGVYGKRAVIGAAMYAFVLYKFEKATGGYCIGKLKISSVVLAKWISLFVTECAAIAVEYYLYGRFSFLSHLGGVALAALFTFVWAIMGNKLALCLISPLDTILVYDKTKSWDLEAMKFPFPKQLNVIGQYEIQEGLDNILEKAKEAKVLYLYRIPSEMRNDLLKFAAAHNLYVYIQPKLGDLILNSTQHSKLFNLPVLRYESRDSLSTYGIQKRAFDIVGAMLMLAITSPFFLIISILIKLDDWGPVFYRQTRLTRDRKEFQVIKFRTMHVKAEADGVARLSSKGDPRITRVGKWLRKSRMDELPQFINVLKGEMSIVGPRPERPEIAIQYEQELPEFSLRLLTKAGITGYAQIHGKYNTPPYDKLQMDLLYILNQSIYEDFRLVLMTLHLLVTKDSTEGVKDGQMLAGRFDERNKKM